MRRPAPRRLLDSRSPDPRAPDSRPGERRGPDSRPLDLNEIAVFSAVAEEGSLTRAAARLGMPKSTVSRKLSALEERLRARLLHRSPRRVELTEAGRALHVEARTALAQIEVAAERVSERGDALQGRVRLSVPLDFGVAVVAGPLCEFGLRYPDITIDVVFTDRAVDLAHEGFDCAVRAGALHDPSLIARQIGTIRGHLVASPAYAARHGLPRSLEELTAHRYIEFHPSLPLPGSVRLHGPDGALQDVAVNSVMRSNSLLVTRDAIVCGLGIGRLSTYLTADLLAAEKLVHVLPDYWTDERAVYLVHTGRKLLPARVKLLLEFLERRFETSDARRPR